MFSAETQLKENSQPGPPPRRGTSHPAFAIAISNTATEFDAALYDFRSGPLCSGYFRDSETGLDYADQRYHQPGMGRFVTVDPDMGSAHPDIPSSWSRYSYVGGDPINFSDPSGLDGYCGPHGTWMGEGCYMSGSDTGAWDASIHTTMGGPCTNGSVLSLLNPTTLVACQIYPPLAYVPPPPAPKKPTCADSIPQSQIAFVQNNVVASGLLSVGTGGVLSGAMLLGWAALESGWGTNTWSQRDNNFFSYALGRQYSSFYSNGSTAIFSSKNYFTYNGQTGVSSLTILSDQFASGASVSQAFGALAAAGYDSADAASYGDAVVNRWLNVVGIEICLSSLGLLP